MLRFFASVFSAQENEQSTMGLTSSARPWPFDRFENLESNVSLENSLDFTVESTSSIHHPRC